MIKFYVTSCFAGVGPTDELTTAARVVPSVVAIRWTYVCSSILGRCDEGGTRTHAKTLEVLTLMTPVRMKPSMYA